MKKLILSICTLLVSTYTIAQVTLPQKPHTNYTDLSSEENKYWCAIEGSTGSTIKINHKNLQMGNILFTNGYRFCEYIRLGIGAGVRYYYNNSDIRGTDIKWAFPIFADIRGNILSQDVRSTVPYYALDIGAAIQDGIMISPTIGLRFGRKRSAFLIGLNYEYDQMRFSTKKHQGTNSVLLRLGYEF